MKASTRVGAFYVKFQETSHARKRRRTIQGGCGIGIADVDRHMDLVQTVICLKTRVLMYNYYPGSLNTF